MFNNWILIPGCCQAQGCNCVEVKEYEGCRNGIKVVKRTITNKEKGCEFKMAFSDGGTPTHDGSGVPGVWLDKKCRSDEFDKSTRCERIADINGDYQLTGVKVQIITTYNVGTSEPINTYRNLKTGLPWLGDPETNLINCPDVDTESDYIPMHDAGNLAGCTKFLRWIVKKDSKPTGIFYDTDTGGLPYTVVGPVSEGECPGNSPKVIPNEDDNILATNTPTGLTPPTGAKYAVATVVGGSGYFRVDGGVPAILVGHPISNGQKILLQIEDDINNFKIIGNPQVALYVTYYDNHLLLSLK